MAEYHHDKESMQDSTGFSATVSASIDVVHSSGS